MALTILPNLHHVLRLYPFYTWRKKYGGISPSELKHMRQLEEENLRLKRLVADLSLDKAMLQDVLAKKS